jgi:hypothetical protein
MRRSIGLLATLLAGSLWVVLPLSGAAAEGSKDKPKPDKAKSSETAQPDLPDLNLIDAMRQGVIGVQAEGIGDGRMTLSVTNRTSRPLRVVLPPGIVAQSATAQFGGMGGMGGGMGGMGGGMGGMGGGMGGMGGMGGGMGGMGGGMGGMGGMGRMSATMPPMMGMMMLANLIMYFCGDPDSWDRRSLMMGMGGGMGMGGMGGMGMGGGMGGMGGMMGGGMRSVPPTDLPSAELQPRQTRRLPTRLVSLTPPDPQAGLVLPEKGEPLQIVGDVARVNNDPQVQKALKRLATDKAPTTVAQMVMWRLAGGLEWDDIAELSAKWANRYELSLAQDFVSHLDRLVEGDSGRLLFQISGTGSAGQTMAAELSKVLQGKTVLGLQAETGIPARPDGPAVACRVRLNGSEGLVEVAGSDAAAQGWVPFGKFSLPVVQGQEKFDAARFADSLAEGILNRLVRTQLTKGPRQKDRPTYGIRIDNASPLILNGLAVLGTARKTGEIPKLLWGISIPPRKSMTLPASEEAVKTLGLKQGIRVIAIDLSGL